METSEHHINYKRIEAAIKYLENNFQDQPDLDDVAEKVHLSPFHFQRIFTEWAGISPKKFLQYLTIDYLKGKLDETKNLVEAAERAGLSSQSRVYDLFTTLEAMTPQEYKLKGSGIRISYGFHDTQFGEALLGVTDRGICWLSFVTENNSKLELNSMKQFWNNSIFVEDSNLTNHFITAIFKKHPALNQRHINPPVGKLNILVKGTIFQVKVWEALLRIPNGTVTTYGEIAKHIENPNAVRAVGSAVGGNHVGFLIPCHRVIRSTGIVGDYHWGSARKKGILGMELAKVS